jgi:hypothetical protein
LRLTRLLPSKLYVVKFGVAPVVVSSGTITSYPALYLWNQPVDEANHTPAWDEFHLGVN